MNFAKSQNQGTRPLTFTSTLLPLNIPVEFDEVSISFEYRGLFTYEQFRAFFHLLCAIIEELHEYFSVKEGFPLATTCEEFLNNLSNPLHPKLPLPSPLSQKIYIKPPEHKEEKKLVSREKMVFLKKRFDQFERKLHDFAKKDNLSLKRFLFCFFPFVVTDPKTGLREWESPLYCLKVAGEKLKPEDLKKNEDIYPVFPLRFISWRLIPASYSITFYALDTEKLMKLRAQGKTDLPNEWHEGLAQRFLFDWDFYHVAYLGKKYYAQKSPEKKWDLLKDTYLTVVKVFNLASAKKSLNLLKTHSRTRPYRPATPTKEKAHPEEAT